jgi:hypothetical protein
VARPEIAKSGFIGKAEIRCPFQCVARKPATTSKIFDRVDKRILFGSAMPSRYPVKLVAELATETSHFELNNYKEKNVERTA